VVGVVDNPITASGFVTFLVLLVPAVNALNDLKIELVAEAMVLAHEGLGGGIIDIKMVCSLDVRACTSLISLWSQSTFLSNCILTLWVTLSYLLLRFLLLTSRNKGI